MEDRIAKIQRNGENWLKFSKSSLALAKMRNLLDESAFITERIAIFDRAQVQLLTIGTELSDLMDLTKNKLGHAHYDLGRRYIHEPTTINDGLEQLEKQVLFSKGASLLAIEYELLNNTMASFFKSCRKGPPSSIKKVLR